MTAISRRSIVALTEPRFIEIATLRKQICSNIIALLHTALLFGKIATERMALTVF
jgi:hypothetical protein